MKKVLGLLMLLISMQVYAVTMESNEPDTGTVNVELKKGNADNSNTHLRTLIPMTCVYAYGTVQLGLLGEVGEFTLTVTHQVTGEQWSAENALTLQTSTVSGTYWVQIVTEDGSVYYGSYTL